MRADRLIPAALVLALGLAALLIGTADDVAAWAASWQREFQNGLAGALRALQAGDPGATLTVLSLCFAYGFVHAAGPGHGKFLIGGYGVGSAVKLRTLALVALASSLGQAVTAVGLVALGFGLLGISREALTDMADGHLAVISFGAIGAIGVWLMIRGMRHLRRQTPAAHHHDHAHHEACGCGHAHAPSPDDLARAGGARDIAALIGAIAIRPCTGALFLLVIAWYIDLPWIGIAGAFAMGFGTAAVTILVAILATSSRQAILTGLSDNPRLARLGPILEICAGAAVILIAAQAIALQI